MNTNICRPNSGVSTAIALRARLKLFQKQKHFNRILFFAVVVVVVHFLRSGIRCCLQRRCLKIRFERCGKYFLNLFYRLH